MSDSTDSANSHTASTEPTPVNSPQNTADTNKIHDNTNNTEIEQLKHQIQQLQHQNTSLITRLSASIHCNNILYEFRLIDSAVFRIIRPLALTAPASALHSTFLLYITVHLIAAPISLIFGI